MHNASALRRRFTKNAGPGVIASPSSTVPWPCECRLPHRRHTNHSSAYSFKLRRWPIDRIIDVPAYGTGRFLTSLKPLCRSRRDPEISGRVVQVALDRLQKGKLNPATASGSVSDQKV